MIKKSEHVNAFFYKAWSVELLHTYCLFIGLAEMQGQIHFGRLMANGGTVNNNKYEGAENEN